MDQAATIARDDINAALVRRLIDAQFPQWADLPVRPVERGGNDNRTFHLGDEMSVRLPSAAAYAAQVEKEQRWLPTLAPLLPLAIPQPLARGAPGDEYPWPWSVYRWIEGGTASADRLPDLSQFAADVAGFLNALHRIDATGGPPSGPHCFHRGGSLAVYDRETHQALSVLGERVDAETCRALWKDALASTWEKPPVWVHGDIAVGNLLLKDGALSAVIDFGCSCVGDPACDLVIAWMLFDEQSRATFREALPLDAGTWARARGWAMWKALKVLSLLPSEDNRIGREHRRALEQVLTDYRRTIGSADAATIAFYDNEAPTYAAWRRTARSSKLDAFIARVGSGAKVLELGCGGGQEAEHMIAAGLDVTPTDASAGMAAQASQRLKREVRVMRFDELDETEFYDGVWANACLLHAPSETMPDVLARIWRSLKPGGVFFASYKAGDGGDRDKLGRYYNFPDRTTLEGFYASSATWGSITMTEGRSEGGYDGVPRTWLFCTAVK